MAGDTPESPPAKASTVRALGAALGLSKSRIGQLSAEPWWPKKGRGGWDVAACRAAYEQHVRGGEDKESSAPPAIAPAAPATPPAPLNARAQGLVETLRRGDDALEMSRAAAQLIAARFADAVEARHMPARAATELNDALEELRRTEAAVMTQRQRRGELIERDTTKACMGALARRFVLALDRLESRVSSQVEMWLADDRFRDGSVEERGLAVRAWVRQATRQARFGESAAEACAEFERMVQAESDEGRSA